MNTIAPIALFTYNRLQHTKETIETLANNYLAADSELYIFSDAPRSNQDKESVEKVRNYLTKITGFKAVHLCFQKENKGLAKSIIDGVSQILSQYPSIIVLEDDLQTSPWFLTYMNKALQFYSPNQVWSIAGYSPPIFIPKTYPYATYLAYRNCSWGWATWKQNWEKTDWQVNDFSSFIRNSHLRKEHERGGNDLSAMLFKQQMGKIHSWSIRFNYAGYKNNLPSVYPTLSFIKNTGADGSGTNMKKSRKFNVKLNNSPVNSSLFSPSTNLDIKITKEFKQFYNTSVIRNILNKYLFWKYLKK
jgi:hypothetical protein